MRLLTVYFSPSDYPGRYVVRGHRVTPRRAFADARPTAVTSSLEEARAAIPDGLVCIGRSLGDDPVIVETWL